MIERRRSPRTVVQSGETIRLELRHRVRLMDLSQSGALVECESRLPVGTHGHFRAELSALPFSADLTVRRQHGKPGSEGGLGTQFGSMDQRSRKHLEQFLRRGKH